jgi:hypothetical protein
VKTIQYKAGLPTETHAGRELRYSQRKIEEGQAPYMNSGGSAPANVGGEKFFTVMMVPVKRHRGTPRLLACCQ